MSVIVEITCPKHPFYSVKREARDCYGCKKLWWLLSTRHDILGEEYIKVRRLENP